MSKSCLINRENLSYVSDEEINQTAGKMIGDEFSEADMWKMIEDIEKEDPESLKAIELAKRFDES